MDVLYVSSDRDEAGQKALRILADSGRQTRIISESESAPEGSIAVFAAPEKLRRKRQPRYFCLSAAKISDDLVPDWARTTQLRVAVCTTEDRIRHQQGSPPGKGKVGIKSTFAGGVLGMATTYERWLAGKSGWLVPWAALPHSDTGDGPAVVKTAREWLKRVQPEGSMTLEQLTLAQRIQTELAELPLGFGSETGFDKTVGPEPLWARAVDVRRLERQAFLLKSLIAKCLTLYRSGLDGGEWAWVTKLIDGASPAELVELSHRCARFEGRTPILARADQPDFGTTVELQLPGSGWGYMAAVEEGYRSKFPGALGPGFALGFTKAMQELTGQRNVVVLHANNESRYTQERRFFVERCNGVAAGEVQVRLSEPWSLDLSSAQVVRRCFLDDLIKFQGANQLLDLYFAGAIKIEPPPCLLYDQKVWLSLPFDQRSRDFFTGQERALLPETYLVQSSALSLISGGEIPWAELADLKGAEREWILKYAGSDQKRRGGAVAVWSLGSKDSSAAQVRQLLSQALADWHQGEPWIIQRRVKRKFPVAYLGFDGQIHDEEMYARITPVYNLGERPRLIAASVNLRRMWKVHGQPTKENDPNVLLAVHQKEE